MPRIFARVDLDQDPTSCWPWPGAKNSKGYGSIRVPKTRRMVLVSRVIVASLAGKENADDVDEACHTCDNPPCCNPAHLFDGSTRENVDDMVQKGRSSRWSREQTHCAHDHEYTPANTQWWFNSEGRLSRRCVACRRRRSKESEDRRALDPERYERHKRQQREGYHRRKKERAG